MARSSKTSNHTHNQNRNPIQPGERPFRLRPQNAVTGVVAQPKSVKSPRTSETRAPRTSIGSKTVSPGFRARSRKGRSLASARDRMRLRERNVAERARVEKMLATVPIPDDRRETTRDESGCRQENRFFEPGQDAGYAMGLEFGCPVCGDSRTVTDEVIHGGTLSVSECLHCDHRWTARPKVRWVDLGARMSRGGRPRAVATA